MTSPTALVILRAYAYETLEAICFTGPIFNKVCTAYNDQLCYSRSPSTTQVIDDLIPVNVVMKLFDWSVKKSIQSQL